MAEFNDTQIARLRKAIEYSRRKLQPFREKRFELLREYVGYHYSDDGTDDFVPVNLVEMAVKIYTAQLAARAPAVLVTTPHAQLKDSALKLELAVNHLIQEIRLERSLKMAVTEALFSFGIMKVGLASGGTVEIDGFLHDVGQPFADVVSLDDWVQDMNAKDYEHIQFAGNRYQLPLDYVKESGVYTGVDSLVATPRTGTNEGGDDKAKTLSVGSDGEPEELHQLVDLWDLWLPQENIILTIPAGTDGVLGKSIRTTEWEGPEVGPYHILGFNDVPGNAIPMAPAATWLDLHDVTNRLYRKMIRQAERQKNVYGAKAGDEDDANKLLDAKDGELVSLTGAGVQEIAYGGANNLTMAMGVHTKDMFGYLAGNLDVLGGLSAQSETASQDQMLAANASKRVSDMQNTTVNFSRAVIESLAWYLWTDPLIDLPLVKRYEKYNMDVPVTFSPEDREGDFLDYNMRIEPYSMQESTPASQLNTLMQLYGNILLPAQPMLEAQGMTINFEGLVKKVAKLSNIPDLADVINFTGQSRAPEQGIVEPGKPQTTRHVNERISRSGNGTTSGQDKSLVQQLVGGGKSEMAGGM